MDMISTLIAATACWWLKVEKSDHHRELLRHCSEYGTIAWLYGSKICTLMLIEISPDDLFITAGVTWPGNTESIKGSAFFDDLATLKESVIRFFEGHDVDLTAGINFSGAVR